MTLVISAQGFWYSSIALGLFLGSVVMLLWLNLCIWWRAWGSGYNRRYAPRWMYKWQNFFTKTLLVGFVLTLYIFKCIVWPDQICYRVFIQ